MKKMLLLFWALVLLPSIIMADFTITINVQDSFSAEKTLMFDYSVTSTKSTEINYIPYIDCPTAPRPFLEEKTITLTKNEPYESSYSDITIDESIEPQTCTAFIQITSPKQIREEKTFTIDTKPSFELKVLTCRDSGCTEKTKTFAKNSDIYINFESEVEKPEITTVLTYPDKTTQEIILPASIKAEQVGTYTIEVAASKDDYKTITKKELFGVIEKEAEIKNSSECNGNGLCDGTEDNQKCPQDCLEEEKGKGVPCNTVIDGQCNPDCASTDPDCVSPENAQDFTILWLVFAAIIGIAYLLYTMRKKKQPINTR